MLQIRPSFECSLLRGSLHGSVRAEPPAVAGRVSNCDLPAEGRFAAGPAHDESGDGGR